MSKFSIRSLVAAMADRSSDVATSTEMGAGYAISAKRVRMLAGHVLEMERPASMAVYEYSASGASQISPGVFAEELASVDRS